MGDDKAAGSSALLWDGIFHSLAWQPSDICYSDAYLAALPNSRHGDSPPPPFPAQPCCLSGDTPSLGTGAHEPHESHMWLMSYGQPLGLLTALRQMKEKPNDDGKLLV